jgi:hypothetical protein
MIYKFLNKTEWQNVWSVICEYYINMDHVAYVEFNDFNASLHFIGNDKILTLSYNDEYPMEKVKEDLLKMLKVTK